MRPSLPVLEYLSRGVAQWLARYVRDVEAGGSNPLTPTSNRIERFFGMRAPRFGPLLQMERAFLVLSFARLSSRI